MIYANIKEVNGEKTPHGAIKRTFLERAETRTGGLEVNHYTLAPGSRAEFNSLNTEVLHYVIHGCAAKNQPNGDLLHQDTAWFVPNNGSESDHALCHSGEGKVRILSISHDTPTVKSWAASRRKNVNEIKIPHSGNRILSDVKIFKEEEFSAMGAQKMHRLNRQTVTPGLSVPGYMNTEQVVYVLTGAGTLSEETQVSTGSLIYKSSGKVPEIKSVEELNCLVLEFTGK